MSYFKNGYVNEPEEITQGLYEAIVEGTEAYTVQVTIKNGIIKKHACSCPFDMGPVCKHVVALVFYLQQDALALKKESSTSSSPKKKTKKRKTVADQITELLEIISHDELKQFILEKTIQNPLLRNLFLSSFAQHNTEESKELYQKKVQSILQSASDGHGYVDWSAASHVGDAVANLLDAAEKQFENENYRSAVFICTAIMEQMTDALEYVDDSDGDISGNVDCAYEMLHDIANANPTEEIRKLVLNYCTMAYDKDIYSGWDWHIGMLQISSLLLKTDDETERLFTQLDKAQKSEYEREIAQSIKYEIFIETKGEKEADKYLEQNIANSRLRTEALLKALGNKNYEKANSIALDGVNHDKKDKPGLAKEWYDWLLKIAQAKNDKEKIMEYSRLLFIENYRHGQDYYQILKKNVQADKWSNFVEEIIKDITIKKRWLDTGLLEKIYIKEKWWDRLFERIKANPPLSTGR